MAEDKPIAGKPTLDRLIELLGVLGINNIKIHQMDFLMMYFPVYMLVDDLIEKGSLTVDFVNYYEKSDDDIIEQILNSNTESIEKKELNLYLCEPVPFNARSNFKGKLSKFDGVGQIIELDRTGSKVYLTHEPFINFPPIYGIAQTNNEEINKIKTEQELTEQNERGKPKHLTRTDYAKHFSAKFSLLQKNDFRRLVASIYPKGSTTDWFIRKNEDSKLPLCGQSWRNITEEFEDMFHNHVDVALTVQPWVAIDKAKTHNPPHDIEIVYKSRTWDYNCTSLLFVSNDVETLILGKRILNLIGSLIQREIHELYNQDKSIIKNHLTAFCRLKRDKCAHSRCNLPDVFFGTKECLSGSSCKTLCVCECCGCSLDGRDDDVPGKKDGCIFINQIAIELLADSQIYKKTSYENTDTNSKAILRYVSEKYEKSPNDLLQIMSGRKVHALDCILLDKCQKAFIEAAQSIKSLNLSNAYAKLIGPAGAEYSEGSLEGFFYFDSHSSEYTPEDRPAAINSLKMFLDISKISLPLTAYENCDTNEKRKIFVNEYLETNRSNVLGILKSKVPCEHDGCGITWEITYINNIDQGEKGPLALPSSCLGSKLDFILRGMIRHSFCTHNAIPSHKNAVITIHGSSLGRSTECLYVLALEISAVKPWDEDENFKLKSPKPAEYLGKGLLPYCDYLVLVPKDNNYQIANLAGNEMDCKFKPVGNVNVKVRNGNYEISVNQEGSKVKIEHVDGRCLSYGDGNSIIHLLIFCNRQKID